MIKLILEKDVKNLGKAGDKVSVRPGYARNWLLPQKMALTLNERRLKEWRHKQAVIEVRKRKAAEGREKTLKQLSHIHLVFEKEAKASGALFGSLTAAEISRALEEKHQLSVDKKDILTEPLKAIGKHSVKAALGPKQEAYLTITVKKAGRGKEGAGGASSLDEEEMEGANFSEESGGGGAGDVSDMAQTGQKGLSAADDKPAKKAEADKTPAEKKSLKDSPASKASEAQKANKGIKQAAKPSAGAGKKAISESAAEKMEEKQTVKTAAEKTAQAEKAPGAESQANTQAAKRAPLANKPKPPAEKNGAANPQEAKKSKQQKP